MHTVKITTSQNIDIEYDVAGLGERILSYLIDVAIFFAIYLLLFFSTISSVISASRNSNWFITMMIGFFLIYALYDLVCEVFFNGQSIGKRAMKIRVVSLDGARPSVGQYLLRWIFRIADSTITMGLGAIISVAVSEKKQRIGDIVAGTTLIKITPRATIDHVAFIPPAADYSVSFFEAGNLKDHEVTIIHEVLKNFKLNENYSLLHTTASKIREHLGIMDHKGLDDEQFLSTVVNDYNHVQASMAQEER